MGTKEDLEKLTLDLVKADHARRYHATRRDSVAGGQHRFRLASQPVGRTTSATGSGTELRRIELMPPPGRFHHEIRRASRRTSASPMPVVQETDPDYYTVRMATEVLSGGMSGRLFHRDSRETRAVLQRLGQLQQPERARAASWATPAPATSGHRRRSTASSPNCTGYADGVTKGRTGPRQDRPQSQHHHAAANPPAPAPARSPTTFSCAAGFARWMKSSAAIDGVTVIEVNAYLKAAHKPGPFTIVTVGPKALKLPKQRHGNPARALLVDFIRRADAHRPLTR
jgi:hypothetical protein